MKRRPWFVTIAHVSFLLKNGANPNVCSDGSNSALLEAISFPSFKVANVLIDAKANVNHIGKDGNTVLHALFSKGIVIHALSNQIVLILKLFLL